MSIKTSIKEWVKWHFLMEKSIEKYIASLPRCSKYIVIPSPDGLYEGKCKIVLEASELLHCLEAGLVHEGYFVGVDQRVVRESIRKWLKESDHTQYATALFPEEMMCFFERPYSKLISLKKARIYCFSCNGYTSKVNKETLKHVHGFIEKGWFCTKGHPLFGEEQRIHIKYSSSYLKSRNHNTFDSKLDNI